MQQKQLFDQAMLIVSLSEIVTEDLVGQLGAHSKPGKAFGF